MTEDSPQRFDVLGGEESCGPALIPTHERRFIGFDEEVIAMYVRGMTAHPN